MASKGRKRMGDLSAKYDLGVIQRELVSHYINAGDKDQASTMAKKAIESLEKAGAKDLVDEVRELIN